MEVELGTIEEHMFHNVSADSMNMNFTEMEEEKIRRLTQIIVPVTFGIILTVGLIGNILVIAVVSTNPQMRNTTNLLILNLAVADLLFITMCVPFTAVDYAIMSWPFGLVWCRTVQYIIYVTAYVSIYTLVMMSGDRFLAVVFPVTSLSIRTIPYTKVAIASTWIVILVCSAPIWFSHNVISIDELEFCRFDEYKHSFTGFHVGFFVTSFAVPVLIILILYLAMLGRLWTSTSYRISKQGLRAKKRVTKLVMAVIIAFTVCWCPIQVILVVKALNDTTWDTEYDKIVIQIISHVMAYTNSCLNPILYAMMSKNFRCGFCQLVPLLSSVSRRASVPLQYEMTSRRKRKSLRSTNRSHSQEGDHQCRLNINSPISTNCTSLGAVSSIALATATLIHSTPGFGAHTTCGLKGFTIQHADMLRNGGTLRRHPTTTPLGALSPISQIPKYHITLAPPQENGVVEKQLRKQNSATSVEETPLMDQKYPAMHPIHEVVKEPTVEQEQPETKAPVLTRISNGPGSIDK